MPFASASIAVPLLFTAYNGLYCYAKCCNPSVPAFAYSPTDVRTDTARLDLWQDVSLPFQLGALKVVPYATLDGAFYSQDVNGDSLGRAYGGLGSRFNLPLSKIYPDVSSDLFNLNGIYHKVALTGNYYNARSTTSMLNLRSTSRTSGPSPCSISLPSASHQVSSMA